MTFAAPHLVILSDPTLMERGIAQRFQFAVGDNIVNEGDSGRGLFLLEAGKVRVSSRVDLENDRHIHPGLCDLEAGGIFGELSLMDDQPRSATVTVIEAATVLQFDVPRLMGFFDEFPEKGYVVLKSLCKGLSQRLRQADKRLESLFAWGLKAHGMDQHL